MVDANGCSRFVALIVCCSHVLNCLPSLPDCADVASSQCTASRAMSMYVLHSREGCCAVRLKPRRCLTSLTSTYPLLRCSVSLRVCVCVCVLQVPSAEVEADVYQAATYVATHTMKVLEELFSEARSVQCAQPAVKLMMMNWRCRCR